MDTGKTFERLLRLANDKGITVKFAPLRANYARIKDDRIAIQQDLPTIEDINYNLAHEIAHAFLHYDKGEIIDNDSYEEQADRAAKMLLEAISI